MRLRDRITSGMRAALRSLFDRGSHVPEEDQLAANIEVAQARLAQQQELLAETRTRLQEAETAWQQAQARAAEVQQRLGAAAAAGSAFEAETLQAELAQMQTLAQELGRHVTRLRQSAAEMQADSLALQQRIERGRRRLARLAQQAAPAPKPADAAPAKPTPSPAVAGPAADAKPAPAASADPAGPPPDLAERIQRLALGENPKQTKP